jgi:hypothetical protein
MNTTKYAKILDNNINTILSSFVDFNELQFIIKIQPLTIRNKNYTQCNALIINGN